MQVNGLLVAFCCILPAGASAQVLKCTDLVSGQVGYTDGKCDTKAAARQIMEKPTTAQLAEQDAQAQKARANGAAGHLQEERAREARPAPQPPVAAGAATASSGATSCAQARSNLDAIANNRMVTPQQYQFALAEASQHRDQACNTQVAPTVHYVRRYGPLPSTSRTCRHSGPTMVCG